MLSSNIFKMEFLGEFYDKDIRLWRLAKKYHEETESYDRIVCSGPIRNGAIIPANGRELRMINHNAKRVLKEILQEAALVGFSVKEVMGAIRNYEQ